MEPTRLRPLQTGEILDTAIKIYFSRFMTLAKVVAIVVVPVQIFGALISFSLPDGSTDEFGDPDGALFLGGLAASFAVWAVNFLATTIATGACLKAVSDSYLGEDTTWRQSLAFAGSRFKSLVWVSILFTVITTLGFLACIAPGAYFYVAWAVAVPAVLMEDFRGFQALSRSRRLVEGFWWRTLGVLILAWLISFAVGLVFGALLVAVIFTSGSEFINVMSNATAQIVAATLTTPFTAAVVAVIYFDLRVRKEGFDMELLSRTMGMPPPAFPSGPPPGSPWGYQPPPPPSPWGQQPPPQPPGWGAPGGQSGQWGQQPPPPPPDWPPPGGGG